MLWRIIVNSIRIIPSMVWKIIIYWLAAIALNLAVVLGIAFGNNNPRLASDVSFGIFGISLLYELILYFVFIRKKSWWIKDLDSKSQLGNNQKNINPFTTANGILMFYGNVGLMIISLVMALVII